MKRSLSLPRLSAALLAGVSLCAALAPDVFASEAQGRVVSMQGRVEHAPAARQELWAPAVLQQPLFDNDRVRTLAASRAAVLFVDETQVRLSAGTVLTVRAVKRATGAPSVLDLIRGEAWFRTKNPASGLTVKTAAASAAIRGTEIDLRVGPDDETVLTVVEGSVAFYNDAGSVVAEAGEEARARPGQAPVKRVILNPEDAVQWALFYPVSVARSDLPGDDQTGGARSGFARLRAHDPAGALAAFAGQAAEDPWVKIGAAQAHLELGQLAESRAAIEALPGDALPPEIEVARRTQLAAVALAEGDALRARGEIGRALAIDARALRPLLLLSTLELTLNRKDAARAAAEAALAGSPGSVGALVAVGEVAQADFDLGAARGYLDRALAQDPREVRALLDRARLRFGGGDTAGARADAARAAEVVSDDAQVLSLQGFIKLAAGDVEGAFIDLSRSTAIDRELGEPHLGLGLVAFRRQRLSEGLDEMLTATLLEPKVSLYQSYLGKAYYQLHRFPEGLAALASAKRLDPRDPTPWLYASLFERDQNRQVAALTELREAIARNDNRAVYRSRLLLDRDDATKNVTLAELYRQLGFEAWGAFEATRSLDADYTNASAHLFLAKTYGGLPDRVQAMSSELLQYFLYAPVNRNTFNAFGEYTALLDQPYRQVSGEPGIGSNDWSRGTISTRSGGDRLAHYAFIEHEREDGPRPEADATTRAFAQGKVSLGPRDDVFASVTAVRSTEGQAQDVVTTIGDTASTPIEIRRFVSQRDPNLTSTYDSTEGVLGFKHAWGVGSAFTAALEAQRLESGESNPDALVGCDGFPSVLVDARSDSRLENRFDRLTFQAQQATRLGRHQVIAGGSLFRQDKERRCHDRAYFENTGEDDLLVSGSTLSQRDHDYRAYVRDEVEIARAVHGTLGVTYDDLRYDDPVTKRRIPLRRVSPLIGLAAHLAPRTVVRAAAFRNVASDFIGAKISPAAVAGFAQERSELPTTVRDEADLSVEHAFARLYLGGRLLWRKASADALRVGEVVGSEDEATSKGGGVSVNWVLGQRWSLFADEMLLRTDTAAFASEDNVARVGLSFLHERGLQARVVLSHIHQRFTKTAIPDLPREGSFLADCEATYELAGKRGLATLSVTNIFDHWIGGVLEGLSVAQVHPERRAHLSLRWRF